MARRLLVYLDGDCVGKVRWRSIAEFSASSGSHTLHVRMDWCWSPPLRFDLRKGEIVELTVTIPASLYQQMAGVFFTPGRFFDLKRGEPDQLNI